MFFSCLQAYMTALNSFEKLKIDIIIYFRMFSFSNDLKQQQQQQQQNKTKPKKKPNKQINKHPNNF